ncbi:eIF3 subunit 6 protein [Ostertagia ostertagi]
MAEYDLTKRMAPFFDLHLIIPLLEFIEPRKIYDDASLVEMHRHVLMKTNMIDSLTETYQGQPTPKELETKRAEVLKERDILKAKVDPVIEILELDDVKELMESTRDRDGNNKILDFLQQNHNFQLDMIDALFKYAKFMYECGNYTAASVCLYYYRNLVPQADPNYLNALYGKLASEILLQEWDHARDDLVKLRAYIDSNPFDTEWELIHQRAWLMHWALFVYFNYPKGRDDIIEIKLTSILYQVMCPHLLRYLAVAVVTSKNKQKNSLKDLIKVIDIERHNYQDPVTDFLTCLYIKYDFDEAQEKLRQCEEVLSNDFFLTACLSDFRESARLLIFEMFCRIHQCISIEMLARRLNMSQVEAERWIVDLIRNYRIEGAKIDSKLGQVVMGVKAVSIHEQVMENTKRLTLRAQQIALQLEKARTERKTTVFMQSNFLNPWNYVPFLEEMKQAYARKNGSIQDKVSELPAQSLLEFMIGEGPCRHLRGSNLIKEIYHHVQRIKDKNAQLDANIIADRCFPKFTGAEEIVIERFDLNCHLPKIWAICNNDKYLAQELFDAISINLTYFLSLYALHSLRSQTKIGLRDDIASFYFIPTYNEIKRHIPAKAEIGKTGSFSTCSGYDSEMSADIPRIKRETDIKHHPSTSSISAAKKTVSTDSRLSGTDEAPVASVSRGHSLMNGGASSSSRSEDKISPSPKRMKVEAVAENGHDWSKLKFPRDRPPDDIPVYDYTKVKRENFDTSSAQVEIESQISSDSLSNRTSAVDEWEDVLKSVNADPAIPEGYKMACLVMSNRDLREHNRILRAQLEKG